MNVSITLYSTKKAPVTALKVSSDAFFRICLLSFYFSLNYLLPDCYVLRTPTILPQYSHIVKLTLHFFAHIVGVSQGHFSTFVQAQVEKTF